MSAGLHVGTWAQRIAVALACGSALGLVPSWAVASEAAPSHLVVLLGDLACLDVTNGGPIEIGGDDLRAAFGVLAAYDDGTFKAFGDDLNAEALTGRRGGKVSERWHGGPYVSHPILTLNEAHPSGVWFEAATPGKLIKSLRIAVTLWEYDPSRGPGGRSGVALGAVDGPGTYMTRVLSSTDWRTKELGPGTRRFLPAEIYLGRAVTDFGRTVERITRAIPGGNGNDRIGTAEWEFDHNALLALTRDAKRLAFPDPPGSLADHQVWLRRLFATVAPPHDPATGRPAYKRAFQGFGDSSHYEGELWFTIIPDNVLTLWTGIGRISEPLRPRH